MFYPKKSSIPEHPMRIGYRVRPSHEVSRIELYCAFVQYDLLLPIIHTKSYFVKAIFLHYHIILFKSSGPAQVHHLTSY